MVAKVQNLGIDNRSISNYQHATDFNPLEHLIQIFSLLFIVTS